MLRTRRGQMATAAVALVILATLVGGGYALVKHNQIPPAAGARYEHVSGNYRVERRTRSAYRSASSTRRESIRQDSDEDEFGAWCSEPAEGPPAARIGSALSYYKHVLCVSLCYEQRDHSRVRRHVVRLCRLGLGANHTWAKSAHNGGFGIWVQSHVHPAQADWDAAAQRVVEYGANELRTAPPL